MSLPGESVLAWIGIGSNLSGELASPQQQVRQAVTQLRALPRSRCVAVSSLYHSRPMGPQPQPDYINAVVGVQTTLTAVSLLEALQAIEQRHGRVRNQRWGARTLDLDILLFGDVEIRSQQLTIPHVGLCERDFVVLPLLEVAPTLVIPGRGKLADIARNCPDYGTRKLGEVA